MGVFLSEHYFAQLSVKVDDHLPFLGVKMKSDKLSIGGRSFSYEDATKFVVRDGSYIPVIALRGVDDTERTMDLYPFINIGLTEVLLALEQNRYHFEEDILKVLVSERLFDSVESSLDYINKEDDFYDGLEQSIRTSQMRHDFPAVKKIVCLLNIARKSRPRFYFEQLFDLMKVAYSSCLIWLDKSMENLTMSFASKYNPGQTMESYVEGLTYPGALDTGAISYTTESGVTRTITDGRGLSVYVFLSFLYHTYMAYASFPGGNKKSGIGSVDVCTINKYLEQCIGNDAIGKWLLSGKEPTIPEDKELLDIASLSGLSFFDGKRKTTDKFGNTTTRAMMDNTEMFKRATGWERSDGNSLCYNNCFYETFDDVCCMVVWQIFCHNDYPLLSPSNDFNSFLSKRLQEANVALGEKMQELINEKKTYEAEKNSLSSRLLENEKEAASLAEERDKLQTRLLDLERQLETQRRIAGEQREEIESLRSFSECVYSEEEEDEQFSYECKSSLKEMAEYLNNFKITIVGGHFDTERRLKSMGLTSITYITDEQAASGNPWKADFICICATFVSHKIVRAVESQFQNKRGETMYFNGTNASKLVREMYDFVRKWMGES